MKIRLFYLFLDHGELLGENGKWLHGFSGTEKGPRNPAVLLWYSAIFKENNQTEIEKLNQNKDKLLPLDFVYHSILDLYQIDEKYYDKKESIFNKN